MFQNEKSEIQDKSVLFLCELIILAYLMTFYLSLGIALVVYINYLLRWLLFNLEIEIWFKIWKTLNSFLKKQIMVQYESIFYKVYPLHICN